MGFWHTGYMEHHEGDYFRSTGDGKPVRLLPPSFPCPECGRRFPSRDGLSAHLFDGHPTSRPLLFLRGQECGRSRLTISEPTYDLDWQVAAARSITVNDRKVDLQKAGLHLSRFTNEVVTVVLSGERIDQTFELRFAVADPADLDGVDARLEETVRGHQLTIAVIERFLASSKAFGTAVDYRAGLAQYFYGVLARERSPESGLLPAEYRDRFDSAVVLLGGFDRAVADAVCGLVAFHYNQFDRAIYRTRNPRIVRASLRLQQLLRGEETFTDGPISPQHSSLDYVLSDAVTEQVLTWCCAPLDGSAVAVVEAIESNLRSHELFDQLKLRIVAAENYLRAGAFESGRRHANELRHNPDAETWAHRYLGRLPVGRAD